MDKAGVVTIQQVDPKTQQVLRAMEGVEPCEFDQAVTTQWEKEGARYHRVDGWQEVVPATQWVEKMGEVTLHDYPNQTGVLGIAGDYVYLPSSYRFRVVPRYDLPEGWVQQVMDIFISNEMALYEEVLDKFRPYQKLCLIIEKKESV